MIGIKIIVVCHPRTPVFVGGSTARGPRHPHNILLAKVLKSNDTISLAATELSNNINNISIKVTSKHIYCLLLTVRVFLTLVEDKSEDAELAQQYVGRGFIDSIR